jgi:hypothetical protein
VQLLISGVLLGGIYALAAFGLALIFGVCNILNLAHGEFLMLGALVCFLLGHSLGVDPFAAILVLMPLFFGLGVLFERGLLRSVVEKRARATHGLGPGDAGVVAVYRGCGTGAGGGEEKGLYYSLPPIILGQGTIVISSTLLALGVWASRWWCISFSPVPISVKLCGR